MVKVNLKTIGKEKNSADLLVRFLLQIVDTEPDYLIIYYAYNDISSYLTPNFHSDYSHSSKNFGEVNWKFLIGSKIPNVPINFVNYLKIIHLKRGEK